MKLLFSRKHLEEVPVFFYSQLEINGRKLSVCQMKKSKRKDLFYLFNTQIFFSLINKN